MAADTTKRLCNLEHFLRTPVEYLWSLNFRCEHDYSSQFSGEGFTSPLGY